MKPMSTKHIGLTGNIGSGKSTVAKILVTKGVALIDADTLARSATKDTKVLEEIAAKLGADLVKNGELDRQKTADLIFNNPEARQILNSIIHPWVRQKSAERVAELVNSATPPNIIVQDIPLLFESGLEENFDAVIVVYAPLEQRIARVKERSHLSEEEITARDSAQMTLEEKAKRADLVIDNSRGLEHLQQQVDKVWEQLIGF
jgi:dephospho-CoA kinase